MQVEKGCSNNKGPCGAAHTLHLTLCLLAVPATQGAAYLQRWGSTLRNATPDNSPWWRYHNPAGNVPQSPCQGKWSSTGY